MNSISQKNYHHNHFFSHSEHLTQATQNTFQNIINQHQHTHIISELQALKSLLKNKNTRENIFDTFCQKIQILQQFPSAVFSETQLSQIQSLQDFCNTFGYLLQKSPTVQIEPTLHTTKNILIIGQTHPISRIIGDDTLYNYFIDKIYQSQKRIAMYIQYFLDGDICVGTEGFCTQGKQQAEKPKHAWDFEDIRSNHVFDHMYGSLRELDRIETITQDSRQHHKIKSHTETINALANHLQEVNFMGKTYKKSKNYQQFYDILATKILSQKYILTKGQKSDGLLGFSYLSRGDIGRKCIYAENTLTLPQEDHDKKEKVGSFSGIIDEEFSHIAPFLSDNFAQEIHYEIFQNSLHEDALKCTLDKIKEYTKENWTFCQKHAEEIQKYSLYLGKYREENVIQHIDDNFPKHQKLIPIIFGAQHLPNFTKRIHAHNQQNPHNHYSLEILDLS